ncbi:hypothetical protein NQ317_006980 [Molorchus minor]|uniref:DH domain-containing protein n=1 Tax=Molorchus minor TaxID=1323400 RepID=A0ABQ9IYI1_9CUCU|nr:hypothetical protein NQ317_006980 [Molorchus minor]
MRGDILNLAKKDSQEVKQGQPVSRSGSDRRPDAVREEGLKHQDSAPAASDSSHDVSHDKSETATPESTTSLPATGSKRKINSNIIRSESVKEQSEKRKQRRNYSDPSHNTTSGNVDLERHPGLSNTDSGSSSHSSISCNGRLSESPSNSVDAMGQPSATRGDLDSDSESDIDWEVPTNCDNLPPHEKVINELFQTEINHVENLKVLYRIFHEKLKSSLLLKPDELTLMFPNIKELLEVHRDIRKSMKRQRKESPVVKEIGTMLVMVFNDSLKQAAATFCERQQLALEFIRKRRERDSKFDGLLTECERNEKCRRLPLQGILPTEMQRLSKYPLLLERLISSVESDKEQELLQQEDLANLKRAHHLSKEILNYVNEAAKVALNRHRLEEIQRHLDTSYFDRSDLPIAQDFKSLDLTKYKLIVEGGMQLRRPNKAIVLVHVLLLEEAVIILHREGDRFLLKLFQSGNPAQPAPLSPIIKTSTLLVRNNAACKNALFLFNTSTNNSQMLDLAAEDEPKRKAWFKHFSDAIEAYNKREGLSKRLDPATDSDDSESVQDLPPSGEVSERAEAVGGDDSSSTQDGNDAESSCKETKEESEQEVDTEPAASPEMVAGGGIETSKVSAEEWPLIQPSQVNIAVPPIHTTESMLTPLEQIRRKDALVKQALEDKEGLVADMMSIPREDFQHIADMASVDTSTTRDPSERILASIFQVNQLQKAVNESLNISQLDVVTAKGDIPEPMTIPVTIVGEIAASLSTHLTTLLSEVKQIEKERDMLRKELHRMREQLHVEHNLHSPIPIDESEDLTSTTDCVSEQHNSDDHTTQNLPKSDGEEEQP